MVNNSPNIVLRGAPNSLAITEEQLHFTENFDNVKISMNNYYEHFEPTTERVVRNGNELQVFTWSNRTYVAE